MNYLLDTHTFLWWLSDSTQLSLNVKSVIADSDNRVFISHASQWEVSIKVAIGRLEFPMDRLEFEVEENGFELLSITTPHIIQSSNLPMHHRDPFDRMLIAQAQSESLVLLSKDQMFPEYDVELLW